MKRATPQEVARRVGALMADHRVAQGMNQASVALRLGVSQAKLSRWETARDALTVQALVAWCEVLRVDAGAVLLAAAADDPQTVDAVRALLTARARRPAVWCVVRALLADPLTSETS